jgi:hypothetical protein
MIEIEQSRFTNNGTTSLLHFTPVTDQVRVEQKGTKQFPLLSYRKSK